MKHLKDSGVLKLLNMSIARKNLSQAEEAKTGFIVKEILLPPDFDMKKENILIKEILISENI